MTETMTSEERSEVRHSASEFLNEKLKGNRTYSGYLSQEVRDELVAALGKEAAYDIVYRVTDKVGDLLGTRDEMSQTMAYVVRECESAEQYLRGERGRFNRLGILQSNGVRVDVLAATFSLQYELALDAVYDVFVKLAEARRDPELAERVAQVAREREAAEKESAARQTAARAEREAREALECSAETYGSGYGRGHRCGKAGRYVLTLEDNSQVRRCGTHLKSAFRYTREPLPQGAVGSTLYVPKKGQVRVTAIEDTRQN